MNEKIKNIFISILKTHITDKEKIDLYLKRVDLIFDLDDKYNIIENKFSAALLYLKTNESIITGRSRKEEIVKLRSFICYYFIQYGLSQSQTGYLVLRDHSTVLHHKRSLDGLFTYDKELRNEYSEFKKFMDNVR
jgi:chromosomal replication initiation ATPase DnaA